MLLQMAAALQVNRVTCKCSVIQTLWSVDGIAYNWASVPVLQFNFKYIEKQVSSEQAEHITVAAQSYNDA